MSDRDLIADARKFAGLFTDHAVFSDAGKEDMRRLLRSLASALEAAEFCRNEYRDMARERRARILDLEESNANLDNAFRAAADQAAALATDSYEESQRPSLGYVVLAHYPGQQPYQPSAVIHDAAAGAKAEAADRGSGPSGRWRYTATELREVPDE